MPLYSDIQVRENLSLNENRLTTPPSRIQTGDLIATVFEILLVIPDGKIDDAHPATLISRTSSYARSAIPRTARPGRQLPDGASTWTPNLPIGFVGQQGLNFASHLGAPPKASWR